MSKPRLLAHFPHGMEPSDYGYYVDIQDTIEWIKELDPKDGSSYSGACEDIVGLLQRIADGK